jgi:hypothetical protein
VRHAIVHANGEQYRYVIKDDYESAFLLYLHWVDLHALTSFDKAADVHLAQVRRYGANRPGRAIEYRSHDYTPTAGPLIRPEQVFVLGPLAWPTHWRIPGAALSPEGGRPVHRVDHPNGAFELRTDDRTWRTFWTDKRSTTSFSTLGSYRIAGEAAAEFAFIDAYLTADLLPAADKRDSQS